MINTYEKKKNYPQKNYFNVKRVPLLLPSPLIARQDVEKGSRLLGTILTTGTAPQIGAFKK